jgi:hypothetical protein
MICPSCGTWVNEINETGGVLIYCKNCNLVLRRPYPLSEDGTADNRRRGMK